MAYRLEADEPVSAGIRRVILERIDQAIDDLTDPATNRNKGVHEARKGCKRIRAALRLIRGEIGEDLYQQENMRIRDAARLLASARDSWVMVETLDRLVTDYADHLSSNAFRGVRRMLLAQYERVKAGGLASEEALPAVVEALRASRVQVEHLPIQRENFSVFQAGLQRIYRQGQQAMTAVYAQPSPERFHEWRKRVKYLWYQIEILAGLWPNVLTNLAEELHTLSDYLGDDHDLAVLRRTVLDEPDGFLEEKELLLFVTLIDQQRLALQASAHPLGERIFFDTPKAFARRIKRYWKAWRTEGAVPQTALIQKIQKVSPPSMFSAGDWLTTGEMAARLEMPVNKVRALIHGGKLPAEKVGAIWVIKTRQPSFPEPSADLDVVPDEFLLSTRDTATRLATTPDRVRQLIRTGTLSATKLGRSWVIEASQLETGR